MIYCLGCRYPLRGLDRSRCPECGRAFDPADPATFESDMPCSWQKRLLIASLWTVDQMNGDLETPLFTGVTLHQQGGCIGGPRIRLLVELLEPLPPASIVRLWIPGSVRGITGENRPENRLTGPPPAPGGAGFRVDFRTP